jgi:hypothetical protein
VDILVKSKTLPSTILSHQSIVLPLKIRYPQTFDGTALCIGSMIPDLDLLLPGNRSFHALESLIVLLPLTYVGVILFNALLAPRLASMAQRPHQGRIGQLLAYFGVETWDVLASKRFTARWFIRATYSAVFGILSHFLLDLPTHDWFSYLRPFIDGPMPPWFLYSYGFVNVPFFGSFAISRARILWWGFTIGLGVTTVCWLRYMKKQHMPTKWYQIQG